MSGIEERVVKLTFDNAQFEKGIQTTLASLDNLTKGLRFDGATKGLSDVDAAGKRVDLSHLASTVDDIGSRFKTMSLVAISALNNIVSRAVDAGFSVVKSLTVDPISSGLAEYQTQINAIQTILSNTRWSGTGLDDVNKALDELNHYADLTIYNFTQMTKNIGTFTAAGVKLDVATAAIKGIANLAAVSGSSADQASVAMYQLSQAIATGTVKLIDWNSVVNAGMGGKVFQDALLETARNHHIAVDSMIKDAGSFRATLEKGWLSADILTETLAHFTGDMTKEQLLSMHYTEAQATAIIAMGKDALDAATKVKTISQLMGTLQEAVGSGWTATWELIFGNFGEAKTFFTQVSDVLGAMIQSSANARNDLVKDWKDLGGRASLIEGLANAFHALLAVIKPIADAWHSAFPPTTGKQLYDLTQVVRYFLEGLILADSTADKVRRTFAGLFAILGIGWDVIKGLAGVLWSLFNTASSGSGDILDITARVGDFLVALRKAINEGTGMAKFFQSLARILSVPVQMLNALAHALDLVLQNIDTSYAANQVDHFVKSFGPLGVLADFIEFVWSRILKFFAGAWVVFEPLANKFTDWFHEISDAVGGFNFETLLHAINSTTLAGLVLLLKNAFGKHTGISGVLSELTSSLGALQHTLQAATLLEIALAIGILAVSISVLSRIDPQALGAALAAISVMFAQLIAALTVLTKLPGNGVARLYATAASMTVLAIAIDILVIAVKELSKIDPAALHKGLVGVMVLLASITAASRFLPAGAALTSTAIGLVLLAGAVKILASAVTDLSGLSWEDMAKGLVGVGTLLAALTLFTKFAYIDATGVFSGAGIVLLAVGIKILASALNDISGLSWENVGKGLATLSIALLAIGIALATIPPTAPLAAVGIAITAAALILIGDAIQKIGALPLEIIQKGLSSMAVALAEVMVALSVIPPSAPLSAVGVAIVAASLLIIADAIEKIGKLDAQVIGKGIITIAGALGIIAVAMDLMSGALPGAAALAIVTASLAVLAPVLKLLGSMSWGEIVKGLVAIAAAFIIIGVAGALVGEVVPALLGFAGAVALLGLGLALAGAGVFLFATGLTALSVAGAAGGAAIVAILAGIIGLIPTIVEQVGIALILLIKVLAEAAPELVTAVLEIVAQILEGLIKIAPQLFDAIELLIVLILAVLEDGVPRIVTAGLHIVLAILRGIRDNIQQIVTAAGQVMEQFLKGVAAYIPHVIEGGIAVILGFIRGITKAIDEHSAEFGTAGADLALAIVKGMVKGLNAGTSEVIKAAVNVAKSALNAFKDFLGIHSPAQATIEVGEYTTDGFAVGIGNNVNSVKKAADSVGATALDSLKSSLAGLAEIIDGNIDTNPTITPVLDLTNVKKNSAILGSLLSTKPINVDATYTSAKQASDGYQQNKDTAAENADSSNGTTLNFTQNNTSPKALSSADIYRQTNNQLSKAKGDLPT